MKAASSTKSKVDRKCPDLTLRKVRSALTNGSSILHDVDHRSTWMRRLRDLRYAHETDLGGSNHLSEGQRALIRRSAMLELQLELMEQRFATNRGEASRAQLETYQRTSNSLRRLIETLGLHQGRSARDITPRVNGRIIEAFRQGANI